MTDISAWNEAVDNSQAQLEHQALRWLLCRHLQFNVIAIRRIMNLELMSEYGSESWKVYNETLQRMVELAQKQLVEIRYCDVIRALVILDVIFVHKIYWLAVIYRKKIQEVNWKRKNEQQQAGSKLKQLEERWPWVCFYVMWLAVLVGSAWWVKITKLNERVSNWNEKLRK